MASSLPQYDRRDLAPEDRVEARHCGEKDSWKIKMQQEFGSGEIIVSGSFKIEGISYMKYIGIRSSNPRAAGEFLESLRNDLISLVGGGTRTNNIKLKLSPGRINKLYLEYEKRDEDPGDENNGQGPLIREADWSVIVDVIIKCRDAQTQQIIGTALFQGISSAMGIPLTSTSTAYFKWISPTSRAHFAPHSLVTKPPEPTPRTSTVGSRCVRPAKWLPTCKVSAPVCCAR